jgi:hypothetical protein
VRENLARFSPNGEKLNRPSLTPGEMILPRGRPRLVARPSLALVEFGGMQSMRGKAARRRARPDAAKTREHHKYQRHIYVQGNMIRHDIFLFNDLYWKTKIFPHYTPHLSGGFERRKANDFGQCLA